MNEIGKALVGIGILCALVGAVLLVAGRVGLPLGRLPGDICLPRQELHGLRALGHFDCRQPDSFRDSLLDFTVPALIRGRSATSQHFEHPTCVGPRTGGISNNQVSIIIHGVALF